MGRCESDAYGTITHFDFGWKFFKGDVTGAMQIGFADARWRNADLPRDWSIEGSCDETAPYCGPFLCLPIDAGWRRKTFSPV